MAKRAETTTSPDARGGDHGTRALKAYQVVLPDGGVEMRKSRTRYTHAVIVRGEAVWYVLYFCQDEPEANGRRNTQLRLWPDQTCRVVPVEVVEPLTPRQRDFLVQLGESTLEVFGGGFADLAARGLVRRQSIGMRWWRYRRTPAGRRAVGAPEPAKKPRRPKKTDAVGTEAAATPGSTNPDAATMTISLQDYARGMETGIEALERASRDGRAVIARLPDEPERRVDLSSALALIQAGRDDGRIFFVEVPVRGVRSTS